MGQIEINREIFYRNIVAFKNLYLNNIKISFIELINEQNSWFFEKTSEIGNSKEGKNE